MADPDLELRGAGAGLDLPAPLAFFPSVISSLFTQNKGGPDPPLDPPLGTPYNGLSGEAPPERGTFFKLQVYKRVGISQVEVYKRVGKSDI